MFAKLTWHSISLLHTWIAVPTLALSPFVPWSCSAWSLIWLFDFGFLSLKFPGISWCFPLFIWFSQLTLHSFSCKFLVCLFLDWIWISHHQAFSLVSSRGRARTCGLPSELSRSLRAFCRSFRSEYRVAQSCIARTLTWAVALECPLWPCLHPWLWLTELTKHQLGVSTSPGPFYEFWFHWRIYQYQFAATKTQMQDLHVVLLKTSGLVGTLNLLGSFSNVLVMMFKL